MGSKGSWGRPFTAPPLSKAQPLSPAGQERDCGLRQAGQGLTAKPSTVGSTPGTSEAWPLGPITD